MDTYSAPQGKSALPARLQGSSRSYSHKLGWRNRTRAFGADSQRFLQHECRCFVHRPSPSKQRQNCAVPNILIKSFSRASVDFATEVLLIKLFFLLLCNCRKKACKWIGIRHHNNDCNPHLRHRI